MLEWVIFAVIGAPTTYVAAANAIEGMPSAAEMVMPINSLLSIAVLQVWAEHI